MSNHTDGPAALPPEVVGYATENFVLGADLDGLARVQKAGAPEAVIFYSARILEALTADALHALRMTATANVFANLDLLQQFGLMPAATGQWAHSLRRTGNAVRHVQRRVGPDDAELAVLFVERWFFWFFREFSYGPRLDALAAGDVCLFPGGGAARDLMKALEGGRFRHDDLLGGGVPVALRAPALPAVAAEILLERKDLEGAHILLTAALGVFPEDLRLNQLMGLYWSRHGDLGRARAWLEPLYKKHHDDDETAGITAGVYKRLWRADPTGLDCLSHSHRAYFQGWERSRHTNPYLGINSATTALWLEREAAACDLANHVQEVLTHRAALLAQGRAGAGASLGFWDQVSLGEALVILRDIPAARRAYQQAIEGHPGQVANIEVAREQLDHLLQALGLSVRAAEFLNLAPPSAPVAP